MARCNQPMSSAEPRTVFLAREMRLPIVIKKKSVKNNEQ